MVRYGYDEILGWEHGEKYLNDLWRDVEENDDVDF